MSKLLILINIKIIMYLLKIKEIRRIYILIKNQIILLIIIVTIIPQIIQMILIKRVRQVTIKHLIIFQLKQIIVSSRQVLKRKKIMKPQFNYKRKQIKFLKILQPLIKFLKVINSLQLILIIKHLFHKLKYLDQILMPLMILLLKSNK